MDTYKLIMETAENTVVWNYASPFSRETTYQSEAELEKAFIEQLQKQGYEYLPIKSEEDLKQNLRKQLEKLNDYQFSDTEWKQFFTAELANPNQSVVEKTTTIQEDFIKILRRDTGESKNIYLLDKTNIHNNTLQIINQYAVEEGQSPNRYDCTILVNGLPLVHIELKRRGVDIKEAFNQINRYQRESFWAESGLFEYIQLFVISNGTYTKYYSNTTRQSHLDETKNARKKGKKTSNSFEFTSRWADTENTTITDLIDFTATFFQKHTILNILTKYCVFTSDKLLLVMRPYQIVACEKILNKILISTNYKKLWTTEAGGYIWHTTGSWKTLTSFKTAQLASKMQLSGDDKIDKVLFVVDRKDLDYQTMKEYDKFQKGAANSNISTAILAEQLRDSKANIIITTIQKLSNFVNSPRNKGHEIFEGHIVIIFDECHRSQFWNMHLAITKAFKNYHLFGFTGTPIFTANAGSRGNPTIKTTQQAFGEKLHTYTIVDAINDKNVLPFKVDYISTFREAENIDENEKVKDIDREAILMADERIEKIVSYILEHFNQKTKRNDGSWAYEHSILLDVEKSASAKDRKLLEEKKEKRRLKGFNSMFAVQSIAMAKKYYVEFQKQMALLPEAKRLKIWLIYSFGINEDDQFTEQTGEFLDENSEDTTHLDASSCSFLERAINDYNDYFGTSYDTSSEKFQNYYKDVSMRMKNCELDLLIVVWMFLTGFDATTLNTLWVDKNLKSHGLLQAFSRTNRILNSIKTFGNIVCFRNLDKATNESLALFGDKEASWIVLIKTFEEYMKGYETEGKKVRWYVELVAKLQEDFEVGKKIIGEEQKKEFIKLYGGILKLRNILTTFDEFVEVDELTPRDIQDYHSMYIDLYNEFRKKDTDEAENVNDDIVFEMELIKQVEINIDYILRLIQQYQASHQKDKELLININKAIDSSVELRKKKDLIQAFVDSLNIWDDTDDKWQTFVNKQKKDELEQLIETENLNRKETYQFIENAFRDGGVTETWTAIVQILPPMSRFSASSNRAEKKQTVLDKIIAFFEKFYDISGFIA